MYFRPYTGETVRKVKHSLVRIGNPLLALYKSTEYFSLARTFQTVWGWKIQSFDVFFTGKCSFPKEIAPGIEKITIFAAHYFRAG